MSEEKKRRGRPPLTLEEREVKRIERNRRSAEIHKKNGYTAQKKFRAEHPELYREMYYELKIRVPKSNKELLAGIIEQSGLSASKFVASMIQEKYGVNILESADE